MQEFLLDWNDFEAICITAKDLALSYIEQTEFYLIFAQEGQIVYRTKVLISDPRNTKQIDFEDNYKGSISNLIHYQKCLLTDGEHIAQINSDGSINVAIPPNTVNKLIQVVYDKPHTAINAYEWQDLHEYTVPAGYNLSAISFQAKSETTGEEARLIWKKDFGNFDSPTDTYNDNGGTTPPQFSSRLYIKVTSAIGASNDTVTITYTNDKGETGRTATVVIPKSSLVGTCLEVSLQNGDVGIRDITNVIHTATGQSGAWLLYGVTEMFFIQMTSSGVLYDSPSPTLGSLVVLEGDTIYLQYKAGTKSPYTRRVSFVGTLTEA